MATDETKDRRSLLGTLGALFGGLFALPPLAALIDPALRGGAGAWRRAAALGDLAEGVPLAFSVEVRAGWETRRERGFLLKEGNRVRAFRARCTHLGCTVRLREGALRCPCHGGVFSLAGEPLEGPVRKPLESLETRIDGANVLVRL